MVINLKLNKYKPNPDFFISTSAFEALIKSFQMPPSLFAAQRSMPPSATVIKSKRKMVVGIHVWLTVFRVSSIAQVSRRELIRNPIYDRILVGILRVISRLNGFQLNSIEYEIKTDKNDIYIHRLKNTLTNAPPRIQNQGHTPPNNPAEIDIVGLVWRRYCLRNVGCKSKLQNLSVPVWRKYSSLTRCVYVQMRFLCVCWSVNSSESLCYSKY